MLQYALDYSDLLELFATTLLKLYRQTWYLLDGLLYPMKCILADVFSFALRSIVYSASMCFWPLWLFELLFVYLDKIYIDAS